MFIESARPSHFFRNERNAKHFARCGDDMNNRVAINISPLCGDDSVHILQKTYRRTFEAKPSRLRNLAYPENSRARIPAGGFSCVTPLFR